MYAKYKNKTCRRKKLQFQCNEVKKNVSYYTNIFLKVNVRIEKGIEDSVYPISFQETHFIPKI
jgi:hypothetical protein